MADMQDMTQAITQAATELIKAAVQVMTGAEDEADIKPTSESVGMGLKPAGPTLKQSCLEWNATDKYKELRNFRHIIETKYQ